MIKDWISNFLRTRMIRKVLKSGTRSIYSEKIEFQDLVKRFGNGGLKSQLIAYSALEVASLRVPSSLDERFVEVLTIYRDNLSKVIDQGYDEVVEIQKTKAEIEFLKTMTAFLIAEQNCVSDGYSFESMRYKMEKAKRGPLTQLEWKRIHEQSEEIKRLDKRIDELKIKGQ